MPQENENNLINNNPPTLIENIIQRYDKELAEKQNIIESLNNELNTISTSSYQAGIPDLQYNRGDEGTDFSFPIKWGITCKHMEKSVYLEPLLTFFRGIFNTFTYYLEKPAEYDSNMYVQYAYDFINNQFIRSGGIKELIVNIAYNTLVYGFSFFTPKLERVSGQKYGFKNNLEGIRDFKYYDPTLLYNFEFNKYDSDELQAVNIYTSPKLLGCNGDKGELYLDYLNTLLESKQQKLIHIDFDLAIAGHCSYGNIFGDPLGRPFLYSAYPLWKVLENMDNSFNRNLSNIGEHSFNFKAYNAQEGLQGDKRNRAKKEVQDFVNNKGGIGLFTDGYLEKIECIDANEWWNFRDSMLSNLYKSKNVDIKALGLNKGATRNLADISQTDSIVTASDLIEHFIKQINRTFMRRYFDLNFKSLISSGACDYFKLDFYVTKNDTTQNNQTQISMSGIRKDNNTKEVNSALTDNQGNTISQSVQYDNKGNAVGLQTAIPLSKFVKRSPTGAESFIINTDELERVLVRTSSELSEYLQEFVRNAMNNDDLIKKALEKPQAFIRGSLLSKQQKEELFKTIQSTIENSLTDFFNYKANEIVNGVQENFSDIFGMTISEWVDKLSKQYTKNYIKIITEDLSAKAEQTAINTLFSFTKGYNKQDLDIQQAIDFVKDKIFQFKGRDINTEADNAAVSVFQGVSDLANNSASEKVKDMAIIRVGILENMCTHCQKYFGVLYKKDSQGNYYNIDKEYIKLPDQNCLGGADRCKCYYVPVSEGVLGVINNLLTQKGANK